MYQIKVIWLDGEEELVKQGTSPDSRPASFTKSAAEEMRDFMLVEMEGEVQSINVVRV